MFLYYLLFELSNSTHAQVIDPDSDELPQRAKFTIIATACLLLIMCLLLVGITLRMAPLIDDMGEWLLQIRDSIFKCLFSIRVRKIAFVEELLNSKRWKDMRVFFVVVFYVYMFVSSSSCNIHCLGMFIPFFLASFLPYILSSHCIRNRNKKSPILRNIMKTCSNNSQFCLSTTEKIGRNIVENQFSMNYSTMKT